MSDSTNSPEKPKSRFAWYFLLAWLSILSGGLSAAWQMIEEISDYIRQEKLGKLPYWLFAYLSVLIAAWLFNREKKAEITDLRKKVADLGKELTDMRFKKLEIGDTIEVDSDNRYRLLITSLGWDEEEIAIRLEKVAFATGELPAAELPCELARRKFVCGLCEKVTIFQAVPGVRRTDTFLYLFGTAPPESAVDRSVRFLGTFPLFVSEERNEKQWILISIGRYEKRWFSIRPGSVPGSIPILHEDPPFLRSEQQATPVSDPSANRGPGYWIAWVIKNWPSLSQRLQQAWSGFWTTPPPAGPTRC